jgi:hypothetical protein
MINDDVYFKLKNGEAIKYSSCCGEGFVCYKNNQLLFYDNTGHFIGSRDNDVKDNVLNEFCWSDLIFK